MRERVPGSEQAGALTGAFAWAWFNRLSVRRKLLLFGAVRLVLLMVVLGLGLQYVIQRGFDRVEEQSLQSRAAQLNQILVQSADSHVRVVHDYAVWDDSYRFVLRPSAEYVSDNLNSESLANLRLAQVLILDERLRLVAGKGLDPRSGGYQDVTPATVASVAPFASRLLLGGKTTAAGMLRLGDELFFIAACRILPTRGSRPPVGVYIHMRKVDPEVLREYSLVLGMNLSLDVNEQALARLEPGPYTILDRAKDVLQVGIPIWGVDRQVVAMLTTPVSREVQRLARDSIRLVYGAIFAIVVTSSLLWPLTIQWLILSRLERIHAFVSMLGQKGTMADRLPARVGDELDALATGINQTLDALEASQQRRDEAEKGRQRVQEQMVQNQKFEAIATMAGGIAHDFNNQLSCIMGSLELMQDELESAHPSQKHLERMKKAGSMSSSLVRQMLNLARTGRVQMTPVHLGDAVNDVLKLVRAGLPKTIDIQFENKALDDKVLIDATQLQQVVMNLATNASHAMANRADGCIRVCISEAMLPDLALHPETVALLPGSYLRLAFSDNGCGIPEAILGRIFDPFFTTKPAGSGTGLGLAVTQSFVTQHGGALGVRSEVGKGTTFIIHLPKYSSPAADSLLSQLPGLRVLLVDDDVHGRETLAEGLRRAGHDVTEVPTGASALRLFEEEPECFDVIVTDQIMPGMTGIDLAEQVSVLAPGTPVFLISGYTGPMEEQVLTQKKITGLFMKPIVLVELDRALRQSRP